MDRSPKTHPPLLSGQQFHVTIFHNWAYFCFLILQCFNVDYINIKLLNVQGMYSIVFNLSATIINMQNPSIFTKIINNEIGAYKIYEDDRVIAFLDLHPQIEGHTLVVPKKQVDHVWDLNDGDYQYLMFIAKKVAKHIRTVIGSPRVGMSVEGFGVPHAHVHLLPIYHGNDLKIQQDLESEPDHELLTAMAIRLKM